MSSVVIARQKKRQAELKINNVELKKTENTLWYLMSTKLTYCAFSFLLLFWFKVQKYPGICRSHEQDHVDSMEFCHDNNQIG